MFMTKNDENSITKGLTKFLKKFLFKDKIDLDLTIGKNTHFLADYHIEINIQVDHSKLYRFSNNYSEEYFNIIRGIFDSEYEDKIFDSIKYFGIQDVYCEIYYKHNNIDVYNNFLDYLRNENMEFSTIISPGFFKFGIRFEEPYITDKSELEEFGYDKKSMSIFN